MLRPAAFVVLLSWACLVPGAAAAEDGPVDVAVGASHGSADVVLNPREEGTTGALRPSETGDQRATSERTCTFDGRPVDCTTSFGVWSQELKCWVQRMSPQPPPGSPSWQGHTDGVMYWCTSPEFTGAGDFEFWAPDAGAAGAPMLVDPVTLAEEAIESMSLRAVRVGITPPEGPDTYTLLGIPTWMWVEQPDTRTWGPISRNATAGTVTVSATARVTKVVWDMGDGTVVSCAKGAPYDPSFGAQRSPDCGHAYAAPGRYRVTATSYWEVDWSGAGQAGTITFTLARGASVWVREAHGLISQQG